MRRTALTVAVILTTAATTSSPAAASTRLRVRAPVLTRTNPSTWTGTAASPQLGRGRLVLTGTVTVPGTSTLRFRATFHEGTLRGCVHNTVGSRSDGRQVWDGPGRITTTSRSLARYRGTGVRAGGASTADDPTHARPFSVSSPAPPGQRSPSCGASTASLTHDPARALASVVAAGAPGAIGAVADRHGTRSWASGRASLRPVARMRADQRFRIASVTKTFVATVVLQLAAAGRLSVDDAVERWLPAAVPGGAAITIRELLSHRSGLQDWTDAAGFASDYVSGRRPPGFAWSPDSLLALATGRPARFAPGAGFWYSNTNYLLLRMVAERAGGAPFPALLRRQILDPLGLRSTTVDDTATVAGSVVHGYITTPVPHTRRVAGLTDVRPLSGSGWWGAADMTSTAADLSRFFRALLGGRLVAPALLTPMTATANPDGYGLGLQQLGAGRCSALYGHIGDAFGIHLLAGATRDGRFVLALVNTQSPGRAGRIERAFGATLGTLAAVACGR